MGYKALADFCFFFRPCFICHYSPLFVPIGSFAQSDSNSFNDRPGLNTCINWVSFISMDILRVQL